MIDKLDIRIPAGSSFRTPLQDIGRELKMTGAVQGFKGSEHYRAVVDLRPFEIPAIAHLAIKHGHEGNHKLELIDTGWIGYARMIDAIERTFDIDPRKLEVMRVDLAADIPDVAVSWFKLHCRAQYKRFCAEYEDMKAVSMGRCGVETFNYGKRPNFIRIYDKIAEWVYQYRRELQRAKREHELILKARAEGIPEEMIPEDLLELMPSFEEKYGYPEQGIKLTRVERQVAGGRIPDPISTVGKLKQGAPEFNPYERLELVSGGVREPAASKYDVNTFMAGMWLRSKIQTDGIAHVRTWLNRTTGGHGARTLETYKDFVPVDDSETVSKERIFERYRSSVLRQLAN